MGAERLAKILLSCFSGERRPFFRGLLFHRRACFLAFLGHLLLCSKPKSRLHLWARVHLRQHPSYTRGTVRPYPPNEQSCATVPSVQVGTVGTVATVPISAAGTLARHPRSSKRSVAPAACPLAHECAGSNAGSMAAAGPQAVVLCYVMLLAQGVYGSVRGLAGLCYVMQAP